MVATICGITAVKSNVYYVYTTYAIYRGAGNQKIPTKYISC